MKVLTAVEEAKAEESGEKKPINEVEWKKLLNLLIQLRKVSSRPLRFVSLQFDHTTSSLCFGFQVCNHPYLMIDSGYTLGELAVGSVRQSMS